MFRRHAARLLCLASLLFATTACSLTGPPRPLSDEESEGVERILGVVDAWAEEVPEAKDISLALREAQTHRRLYRADPLRPTIMGVTSGDEIYFAPGTALEKKRQVEDLYDALIALNVVVHEGAHLVQSEEFRTLGLPETDAYRRAHTFDRWLLGAWIDGHPQVLEFLAADDLAHLSDPLLRARRATGGGFLEEIGPVYLLRGRFDAFRRERGRGVKAFEGHAQRHWKLRRDRVRISESQAGLLPAPDPKGQTTLTAVLASEPEVFPKKIRLEHPDGRARFAAGWFLVRDPANGRDLTEEWLAAGPELVLDERLPAEPRLRIEFAPGSKSPRGDFEVVWLPQQLMSVHLDT